MESLFLLFSTVVLALLVLLSSFTPVTLGRIQSPTDEQILTVSDGQQPPPSSSSFTLLQPQDYKAGNQPIRHFWHWVQQQQQPREQEREWTDKDKPKNNRRRRKEVANGEEAEESSSDEEQFKNMSDIVRLHHDDKKTSSGGHHRNQTHESHGIHVASWRWEEVGVLFTFTSFIVVAGLAKVGKFFISYLNIFSKRYFFSFMSSSSSSFRILIYKCTSFLAAYVVSLFLFFSELLLISSLRNLYFTIGPAMYVCIFQDVDAR